MTTITRNVYGLAVSSDRDLFPHARRTSDRPDVVVGFARAEVAPRERGGGLLLMTYAHDAVDYFCERLEDASYVLVLAGSCEFVVTADLARVEVRRYAGAVPGIEDVLASGGLMALLLYLRGVAVLHASAVQHDRGVVAFVGGSGQGKSTMATLLCAGGARIVTDDLLRVDLTDGVPSARLGSPDLRLRKGADTLAESFTAAAPGRTETADARQVIRPPVLGEDGRRLAALYFPIPDREAQEVSIERVAPADAMYILLNTPRLLGWIDPELRAAQFRSLSSIVTAVPVSVARVPWGPPFRPGIAEAIVADVGAVRPARSLADIMAPAR